MKTFLSTMEAGRSVGVPGTTITTACKRGRLPCTRKVGKSGGVRYLVEQRDVEKWARERNGKGRAKRNDAGKPRPEKTKAFREAMHAAQPVLPFPGPMPVQEPPKWAMSLAGLVREGVKRPEGNSHVVLAAICQTTGWTAGEVVDAAILQFGDSLAIRIQSPRTGGDL